MSAETRSVPSAAPVSNRGILITIAILIGLVLVSTAAQLVLTLQANGRRAARAQEATTLVESQQQIIAGLMDDYQQTAYDNPNVDTIYQQQLIAAESMLEALSILAIQNSQIIELLAVSP